MRSTALIALLLVTGCQPKDGEEGPVTDSFGDAQVMGLAVVLSDHQVQVATAALQRGLQRPEVQDYAQQMIATQGPARDRLLQIAEEQNIAVDESTVEARSHITDTHEDIALLQPPVSGTQVDDTYLSDSMHDLDKAITIYDATLLLAAMNPALRDGLTAIRPLYVGTLARARDVAARTGIPAKAK